MQKKVSRRVHEVGKRANDVVGILISNKCIRDNTMQSIHEMKRVTLSEAKKYLFKNGFIKIGSAAPEGMIRCMYEACNLICGSVENHNPDILLYNYLYGRKDNFA